MGARIGRALGAKEYRAPRVRRGRFDVYIAACRPVDKNCKKYKIDGSKNEQRGRLGREQQAWSVASYESTGCRVEDY